MAVTTSYEVHPAIGVARLAPSDDYFLGPEPDVIYPPPRAEVSPGVFRSLRDAQGALRPQAARFRVFECQREAGRLLSAREVTSDEAVITWHVHVMNRKGAAPKFVDPATGHRNTNPAVRRNQAANSNDPLHPTNVPLIINPGKQQVRSDSQQPVDLVGQFRGTAVRLGTIRTESSGRLVFVGGKGLAGSVPPNSGFDGFADSDDWFDDTCDGTVEAEVVFQADGRSETARPAWVFSGPFDFAPEVRNLVTLYDVVFELAVDRGLRVVPSPVYFDRDIAPILRRVVGYQWVNQYARARHGTGRPFDFTSAAWLALADPQSHTGSMQRKMLLDYLRPPGGESPMSPEMPPLYGDNYPQDTSGMWLTTVQYALLRAWSNDDFAPAAPVGPVELLPDALTRMALESCVGRAFYQGIEVSIGIYDPAIWSSDEAFRIAQPGMVQPGILTQSMAVPWQSDFLACAWEPGNGMGWWPAQRPDDVLPEAAPGAPAQWTRGILGRADMIQRWHQLGIVRRVPSGQLVETERTL